MKKNILGLIISFILGAVITILVYQMPRFKYDTNRDGEITLNDAVRIINYYKEKRENEGQ